ncbi:MAG: hypothetical protein SFV54_17385 [Bryobacteraceae bacterium]|nr:hypothetical protein [Bryobacteraceae bacterium]
MFFRRAKTTVPTFEERLQQLQQAGFTITRDGSNSARVNRGLCTAVVQEKDGVPYVVSVGLAIGKEVGVLTDLGYQKVFETESRRREPALAAQLKALHAFTEDLREGLGLTSLYNEGLGTVNDRHVYDRVTNRDAGIPPRPWDKRL